MLIILILIYDERANNHITWKNKTCSFVTRLVSRSIRRADTETSPYRKEDKQSFVQTRNYYWLVYCRRSLLLQFIHEAHQQWKACLSSREKCLDVHLWQFKHIKLIFIYVSRGRVEASERHFVHLVAGWFEHLHRDELNTLCSSKEKRQPHEAIKAQLIHCHPVRFSCGWETLVLQLFSLPAHTRNFFLLPRPPEKWFRLLATIFNDYLLFVRTRPNTKP